MPILAPFVPSVLVQLVLPFVVPLALHLVLSFP
jgi:hypothetical protein